MTTTVRAVSEDFRPGLPVAPIATQRLVQNDLAVRFLPATARVMVSACRWRFVRQLFISFSGKRAQGVLGEACHAASATRTTRSPGPLTRASSRSSSWAPASMRGRTGVGAFATNEQASPDQWADAAQDDAQLVLTTRGGGIRLTSPSWRVSFPHR